MMYWGYGPYMDHGFFGGFFSILVSVAIVVLIFSLIRRGGWRRHRWHGSSALDILEERYAKGEINKDEFEERRKVLLEK